MSYCRWSSMNWKCDLYCYEHVDGTYTTHVATNKTWTPIIPRLPISEKLTHNKFGMWLWMISYRLNLWTASHGLRRQLKAPSAGMTFKDETAEEFKETLLGLRDEGLRFPDAVLEAVEEEIAAQKRD